MYVVYNWLIGGSPDNRVNLYAMKTTNGTDWTNLQGDALTLPLVQDSNQTKVFASAGYVYLKDLKIVNNWLKVLFTESNSADPTKGSRTLKEWSEFKGLNKSYKVEDTSHNYNGAAYIGKHIVTTNSDRNMIGGDIVLRDEEGEIYRDNTENCAYIRKVINSNKKAVASCDNFHLNNTASHYILTLD